MRETEPAILHNAGPADSAGSTTFSSAWFSVINNRWLLIGSLLLFALALNREGDRMPTGNEFIYLLYFFKGWHPSYLATDWTFQEPTAGHAIFNYALGWMAVPLSLTNAAWIGRVACWIAVILGLFRVGRHFKLSPWAVWLGALLWLLQRQSAVTDDWMIGTFEAKTIAYPCLLFAIAAVLEDRDILAGILCGVAFSFHTAVGMWGGAALGLSVLFFRPISKTLLFSSATILFSLPGLITSIPLIFGPHAISLVEAKYLTTVALVGCFDPFAFPFTWMAIMFILPIFAFFHARWLRNDRSIQRLFFFELGLAFFFFFGLFSRAIGRFDWVEIYPMRDYGVFALLLFFWRMMSIVTHFRTPITPPRYLAIAAALLVLSMPSPILQLRDMIGSRLIHYVRTSDAGPPPSLGNEGDFITAARWVAAHTGKTDVVIAPPWWNEGFYYLERPLIVNWHAPRYDAITEWKNRLEAMVGDTTHMTLEDAAGGNMNAAAWEHYATLPVADITRFQNTYNERGPVKWLVTTGNYRYPVAFRANTYVVYQLPDVIKAPRSAGL